MDSKARPVNAMVSSRSQAACRLMVTVGLAWMMLGMVVMPAGVSFNPGKGYQASMIVLLYLPAMWLGFSQRARVWRQLWPLPAFRVFLGLLAWATLSLLWGGLKRPGDELGRLLSVLAFVLGWQACMADDLPRMRTLLLATGVGIAVCAAYYSARFILDSTEDARIVGEGIIATSNYAAALMGAVALWLSQLVFVDRRLARLRYAAIALLLVFIGLTQTRSVWLALAITLVAMSAWMPAYRKRVIIGAALLAAAALVALAVRPDLLTERGTSLRPELFQQSMDLIAQHPLLGLGQGVPFQLIVNGAAYTHTHNALTQITVELGLPGVLLLACLWLMIGWQGWRHRDGMEGRIALTLWVYASVVLQFDMPQLLDSPRPGWLLVWMPLAITLGLAWREHEQAQASANQGIKNAPAMTGTTGETR